MINVAIRVDGGADIGMGHIMRCLSLAKVFRNKGCNVYFISKYREGINKINEEGFILIKNRSDSHYDKKLEPKRDFFEIIDILKLYRINLLIIDSYDIEKEHFLFLKKYVEKIAYIDDLNKFSYPVDILINGNINAQYMNYEKYYDNEIMLLGPKYNLIRDEFSNLPKRIVNREVKEIMITTGGSDMYNITPIMLNTLLGHKRFRKMKINVIIGSGFNNIKELKTISDRSKNIILYQNVKYMSKIMLNSDVAISSGGSTLYELCACGIPTISFIMADNQKEIVKKMSEGNYIISLGWYNKFTNKDLLDKLNLLCNDYDFRKDVSKQMQKLFDGKGTERIVTIILNSLNNKVGDVDND